MESAYVGELLDCSWTAVDKFRKTCDNDGAHLTVIRTAEENTALVNYVNLHYEGTATFLDLICNFDTGKWEWIDGTKPTFLNFVNQTMNKDECDTAWAPFVSPIHGGGWYLAQDTPLGCQWKFMCQENDAESDPDCGSFTAIGTDDADTCLMIHSGKMSRTEGEKICRNQNADLASIHGKEENDFVRRYALSQRLSENIFIGTTLIEGTKHNFSWIDGTPFDYSNFGKGSPNADVGFCVAKDISERGGPWSSVDCESKFSFGCTRPTKDDQQALAPSHCPVPNKFKVGEHIYSPSFPKGIVVGMQCDYIVFAPTGQLVDLEVIS